jgi:hypothetical protein
MSADEDEPAPESQTTESDDAENPTFSPRAAQVYRMPMIGSFGPMGTGGGNATRRCSFFDRREDVVGTLVRARGSYICDSCVQLAATAIENAATDKVVRIRPRPVLTIDRDRAEAEIERAFETVLGGDAPDTDRCQAIESGENLLDTMREVLARVPVRNQVDASIDSVRFLDDHEAEVNFVLMLPGPHQHPGMRMPTKGYAIVQDGAWKMSRETYAELVGGLGISVPPPRG